MTRNVVSVTADTTVREVVEQLLRPRISEDTPLEEIARIIEERHGKRTPVTRNGRLVGIVSRASLLHGMASGIVARHDPKAGAASGVPI